MSKLIVIVDDAVYPTTLFILAPVTVRFPVIVVVAVDTVPPVWVMAPVIVAEDVAYKVPTVIAVVEANPSDVFPVTPRVDENVPLPNIPVVEYSVSPVNDVLDALVNVCFAENELIVDVEKPVDITAPVTIIGYVPDIVACLLLKVLQSALDNNPDKDADAVLYKVDVATHCVDVPVFFNIFPILPELFVLSYNKAPNDIFVVDELRFTKFPDATTLLNSVVPVNVGLAVVGNTVPVPLSVYSALAPAPLNPAIVLAVPVCPDNVHAKFVKSE